MIQKLSICILLCFILTLKIEAKTYRIQSDTAFNTIQPSLVPGDEVIIVNGQYSNWVLDITAKGTAAKPITIRGEKSGMVVFTGNVNNSFFRVSGDYIVIRDLDFKSCVLSKVANTTGLLVEFKNSNYCRLSNCNFNKNQVTTQFTPLVVVAGNGTFNTIENCSFISNIDNQDVQVKVTRDTYPKFTSIQHNLFRDKVKVSWKNGNGGECVQIGQDPVLLGNQKPETTVRENRFTHCDAENEVISNKSSGNRYLNNNFEDNDGELVMRGGHDCIIDGNTFKGGTGGIRINGTGHTITNNKIDGIKTAIRLMYGMAKGKAETGFYIAASGCTIKNNSISNASTGILIGDSKNADWTGKFDTVKYPSPVIQNVAPFDNTITGNVFLKVPTEVSKL